MTNHPNRKKTLGLTARARALFPSWNGPENHCLALRAIASYAAQNPGLEYGNYASDWRDTAGRAAYFSESRQITRDLHRVRDAMQGAYAVTDADVIEASERAFSGRLSVKRCRAWECACGHKWRADVKMSPATGNLSGEATQWCPKCNARPLMGSPWQMRIDYCTGQYWPTEYRKACAAVIETACRIAHRRAEEVAA